MGKKEWASPVPVKPVEVKNVDSSLDAMLKNGVQVYFVSDEQYKKMRSSKRPNWTFLKNLQSENEARGVNMMSLEGDSV